MSRVTAISPGTAKSEVPTAALSLDALRLEQGDRVLIVGGYGVRNVGDEAILAGLLTLLPPETNTTVVSRDPQDTRSLHKVRAVPPGAALPALIRSDVLVISGGGIFSGHMGRMSRFLPLICLIAKARGMRVGFHGVGVYPSTPKWVLYMLARLAIRAELFTVRDRISSDTLDSLGVATEEIPDLSQFMPEAPSSRGEELLRSTGLDGSRPVVGLCLTATDQTLEDSLLRSIPRLLWEIPEAEFCFVPMSHHPTVAHHNDLKLAHRIKERAGRLAILETWHHPSDVLALFAEFSAAVCMRYHSLLFAERAGVPVVPIPYAEKCTSRVVEQNLSAAKPDDRQLAALVRRALAPETVGDATCHPS